MSQYFNIEYYNSSSSTTLFAASNSKDLRRLGPNLAMLEGELDHENGETIPDSEEERRLVCFSHFTHSCYFIVLTGGYR